MYIALLYSPGVPVVHQLDCAVSYKYSNMREHSPTVLISSPRSHCI